MNQRYDVKLKRKRGLVLLLIKKLTEEVITLFYTYIVNNENYLLKHSALIYMINDYKGSIKLSADGEDSYGAEWIERSSINKKNAIPYVQFCIANAE